MEAFKNDTSTRSGWTNTNKVKKVLEASESTDKQIKERIKEIEKDYINNEDVEYYKGLLRNSREGYKIVSQYSDYKVL